MHFNSKIQILKFPVQSGEIPMVSEITLDKSREMYEKAKTLIPGGVSSPVRAIKPYPFYTASADGSKIRDIDGNEYIDYCMAYGPAILGHNHPVIKAVSYTHLTLPTIYSV